MIYLVDILEEIICQVSEDLKEQKVINSNINYLYGHPTEISGILLNLTKNNVSTDKKFPLIWLVQDFEENTIDNAKYQSEVKITLIIMCMTDSKYYANERYTKSYKSLLNPIYESLLKYIKKNKNFYINYGNIPHVKTDRLYWGKTNIYGNEKTTVCDFVDAIEIKNLELKLKKEVC